MNANESPYKVCVVVDRHFGKRLAALVEGGPVWIVDTPENRHAAVISWKEKRNASHLEGVTLFKVPETTSAGESLISNLSTIDDHHCEHSAPTSYSSLEVVETSKTSAIMAAFADGFKASRELSRTNSIRAGEVR